MLIESGLLAGGVNVAASAVGGVALAHAVHDAPWRTWLDDRSRQFSLGGAMVLLGVVWAMKAGITPGLSVRFLLVTALTLMHGWRLAVVAGAIVLAALSEGGLADWETYGANLLCTVVVPALATARMHEVVHARLPRHFFVYLFVTAFFGAALAYNLAGLVRLGLMAVSGSVDAAHVSTEYLAVLPLMSFGEAVVNGMVVAMAVVHHPGWVMSFDDRAYLFRAT